jgi:hypothetical protein
MSQDGEITDLISPTPSFDEPPSTRRGPGRPRKPVVKKEIRREGVVASPMNADLEPTQPSMVHVVELIYDNPTMFRKIFHLLKNMEVSQTRILFEKTLVKMYASDHEGKNQVYIKISGNKMNRYYCEERMEIGLNTAVIDDILQTLTKEHSQIIISITRQYRRSKIKITLSNDEIDDDSVYQIEIDGLEPYNWEIEEFLKDEPCYPVRFELPSKYFKKKVADCGKRCNILRIEKTGFENLRFSYNFSDKRGDHDTYLKDSGKINLISSVRKNDIFSTSVWLNHIKRFSSTLISDTVHFSADSERNLIFTIYLDQEEREENKQKKYKIRGTEKCVVKVVTELVRAVNI